MMNLPVLVNIIFQILRHHFAINLFSLIVKSIAINYLVPSHSRKPPDLYHFKNEAKYTVNYG